MARVLRSGRRIKNASEKDFEQSELPASSPENLNLDSSFGLPTPGPLTQAIIDDLAGSQSIMPELDEIVENDFLLFSPKKTDNSPFEATHSHDEIPPEVSETEQGPSTIPVEPKTVKRGVKPKQSGEIQCPICPKKVKFLRQHLVKSHKWTGVHLRFILSVFSTKNAKSPVYECAECVYRFTHRQRHLSQFPQHSVKNITRDNCNTFPAEIIKYMKEKGVLSERGGELLNKYRDYCIEKMKRPLANFQFDAIAKFFRGTHSMKRPELVGKCLDDLKKDRQYTFSSVRKICFDIKQFIKWMNAGYQKSYRINKVSFDDSINLWLSETSKDCLKEQSKRKQERFAQIPTMESLCEIQDKVENFIENKLELDSPWHTLTVFEKLSLVLFQIHSRANCRVGILLSFTTEQLDAYEPGTFIRSNDHKTGSLFTNYAYITAFEKKVLQELHSEYEEKFGIKPTTIFPGHDDNEFTSQSATISRLMKNLFGKKDEKFNPNSCRKVWETFYEKNKQKIPANLRKIFEANSAHSEKTREKHYVVPPTDMELQNLFDATNDIRVQFRKKRAEKPSEITLTVPSTASEEAADTTEDEDGPQDELIACSSKSLSKNVQVKTGQKSEKRKKVKKVSKKNENSESETDDDSEIDGDGNDKEFLPPRNAKVVKIEDTNIKTRMKNEELYDEIARKLLKFSNRKSFPLEKEYKRACRMVASKRAKLSKGNVKDIVNELKLNEEDTAFVFKKVYCKMVNVYATVKF